MNVLLFAGYPGNIAGEINEWLIKNPKVIVKKLETIPQQGSPYNLVRVWYSNRKTAPSTVMRLKVFDGYIGQQIIDVNDWLKDCPGVAYKDSVTLERDNEITTFVLYAVPRRRKG